MIVQRSGHFQQTLNDFIFAEHYRGRRWFSDTEDPPFLEKQDSWVRTPGEVNPGKTMTVGGVTRKVISMEKAMQIDLSFRKKLEVLQKKTQNVSIQGVYARTSNKGVLGNTPPENKSCPLTQYTRESFFQRTPEKMEQGMTASTRNTPPAKNSSPLLKLAEDSYFQRTPEKREQGMIRAGVKRKDPPPNLPCPPPQHARQLCLAQTPGIYKCEDCNLICSGLPNFQQHLNGKKHKAKVEQLRVQKDGDSMKGTEPLKCSICKVLCMNEHNYREHLAGKKHAACLQAIQE